MSTDFMLQKAFQDRLKRECLADAVEMITMLAESMLDKNRMAPTDVSLTPEETVAKVAEEARTGVLQRLQTISPKEYQRRITEAGRAAERLDNRGGA